MTTNEFAESFVPDRPATVTMTFTKFDVGSTKDGDQKLIAVGEIDGEERGVWLLTTALRNQFRRLDPESGEVVRIEFAGDKRDSVNGRRYYDDKVTAPDRPVEEIGVNHPLFTDEEVDDHGTV
jgi:hypothetical protein